MRCEVKEGLSSNFSGKGLMNCRMLRRDTDPVDREVRLNQLWDCISIEQQVNVMTPQARHALGATSGRI